MRHDRNGARHRNRQCLHVLLAAVTVRNPGQCLLRHVVVEGIERVNETFGHARTHDLGIGFDSASMNVSNVLDVTSTINILENLRRLKCIFCIDYVSLTKIAISVICIMKKGTVVIRLIKSNDNKLNFTKYPRRRFIVVLLSIE